MLRGALQGVKKLRVLPFNPLIDSPRDLKVAMERVLHFPQLLLAEVGKEPAKRWFLLFRVLRFDLRHMKERYTGYPEPEKTSEYAYIVNIAQQISRNPLQCSKSSNNSSQS